MQFADAFRSLTDFSPMKWQTALFGRLISNDVPGVCDIPTGLGKTSILVVWLLALAHQAEVGAVRLPRRLVYIVNRRTVVDQATDVVQRLRRRLLDPGNSEWKPHANTIEAIARRLSGLCADGGAPLGVSTLRGELADNEEWKTDPARPAIVVGTIDMIGSKLLFSGYGDGRYSRAHHAGLVGQDVLIVHDEAHLTPAFSRLLWAIEREQRVNEEANGGLARPIMVMELSATIRDDTETRSIRQEVMRIRCRGSGGDGSAEGFPSLEERANLFSDAVVQHRIGAHKRLMLATARTEQADGLARTVAGAALAHEDGRCRVLIYVRSPEDALKVADALRRALGASGVGRVALLTGTIRGYERDKLVESALFGAFKSDVHRPCKLARTLYLVSTSAGEIGVDLDADHLVCDMAPLDSMVQRFGRVNRLGVDESGAPREATVTVVEGPVGDKDPLKGAIETAGQLLRRLPPKGAGFDASPAALSALFGAVSTEAGFSPAGAIAPLTDILLDGWSLTSIDAMPGRLEVAEYLHGLTVDPPETYVAWRKEILLFDALAPSRNAASEEVYGWTRTESEGVLRDWFAGCRIEAHERLRDNSERVRAKLGALLAAHRKSDPNKDFPVVLVDARGQVEWSTLSTIVTRPERGGPDVLHYRTLVLPVEAGGLDEHGMLDGAAVEPVDEIDVAEKGGGRRERLLHVRLADDEHYRHLLTGEIVGRPRERLHEVQRVALKEAPDGDGGEALDLILLAESPGAAVESPETVRVRQTLHDHTRRIVEHAERIAKALDLPGSAQDALLCAARWHDRGKDRKRWQFYACNESGVEPLAKSNRYRDPRRALGGYRHEFGSVLEANVVEELSGHPERDLILHLIAAHHGWARPHFEPRAYDSEGPLEPATGEPRTTTTAENEQVAVETMQRFGRLQRRFGRWGLAWLESLLRCADAEASQAVRGSA